jgi:hypothetical protein
VGKSKAVRELELQYRLSFARLELAGTIAKVAIPAAAAVAIAWFVTGSIDRLAGKLTIADIAVKFLVDWKITLAYGATAAASSWALLERRLKGGVIKRLSVRVVELETRIDPGRTSSGLTEHGTTSPGDR